MTDSLALMKKNFKMMIGGKTAAARSRTGQQCGSKGGLRISICFF